MIEALARKKFTYFFLYECDDEPLPIVGNGKWLIVYFDTTGSPFATIEIFCQLFVAKLNGRNSSNQETRRGIALFGIGGLRIRESSGRFTETYDVKLIPDLTIVIF